MDQLRALLGRYTQPCAESCEHSQCPLLRELHALVISDALERARLTVKPIVDQEHAGESVGDLMHMRLDAFVACYTIRQTVQADVTKMTNINEPIPDELCVHVEMGAHMTGGFYFLAEEPPKAVGMCHECITWCHENLDPSFQTWSEHAAGA